MVLKLIIYFSVLGILSAFLAIPTSYIVAPWIDSIYFTIVAIFGGDLSEVHIKDPHLLSDERKHTIFILRWVTYAVSWVLWILLTIFF